MKNTRNNEKVQSRKALNNYLMEVETENQHIESAKSRIFNEEDMTSRRFYSILAELEVAICEEL